MAVYEYKGFDGGGKAVTGIVDADNPKVARTRLRKQGLFPTEIQEQNEGKLARGKGLNVEIDIGKYFEFVSPRDVAIMTQQFSTLVGAAVPVVEALQALVDQTEKQKLQVVISQVKERVNEGANLADAMAEHPRVFDNLYVQMVRAGERSGALDEVLSRLAEYTDAQVKLQGKVMAALLYPILMTFVGIGILALLFIGVIPRIRSIFDGFGGDAALPLLTRVVFLFGDFLLGWWFLPPLAAMAGVWGFRRWVATEKGRYRWDSFKLRIWKVGQVHKLLSVSRFCRTLGTLLVSGVPIVTALEISRNVVGNAVLAEAIDHAARNIQEGQSIAVPLRQSGHFPPVVTHMISIGERTGELERMLNTVADAYDSQSEATLQGLTSVLGPAVILAMGGAVFLIALGLLLPMMSLGQMIQ